MKYRADFDHATMLGIGADASTVCDTKADRAALPALQMPKQIRLISPSPTRGSDASALRLSGL